MTRSRGAARTHPHHSINILRQHQRHNKMNGIRSLNHQGHPALDNKMTNFRQLSREPKKYGSFMIHFFFLNNFCLTFLLKKI